jgi:predicted porin
MKSRNACFLASLVFSGSAWAQSSVALYGIVTGNVTYLNNVQTVAVGPGGGRPTGGSQIAQWDSGNSGLNSSR